MTHLSPSNPHRPSTNTPQLGEADSAIRRQTTQLLVKELAARLLRQPTGYFITEVTLSIDIGECTPNPVEQRTILNGIMEQLRRPENSNQRERNVHLATLLALYLAGADVRKEELVERLVRQTRELSSRTPNFAPNLTQLVSFAALRWIEEGNDPRAPAIEQKFSNYVTLVGERVTGVKPRAGLWWHMPVKILSSHGGERRGTDLKALGVAEAAFNSCADELARKLRGQSYAASASVGDDLHLLATCRMAYEGSGEPGLNQETAQTLRRCSTSSEDGELLLAAWLGSKKFEKVSLFERCKLRTANSTVPELLEEDAKNLARYTRGVYAGAAALEMYDAATRIRVERGESVSMEELSLQRLSLLVDAHLAGHFTAVEEQVAIFEAELLRFKILKDEDSHSKVAIYQTLFVAHLKGQITANLLTNALLDRAWPDLTTVPAEIRDAYETRLGLGCEPDSIYRLKLMYSAEADPSKHRAWANLLLQSGYALEAHRLMDISSQNFTAIELQLAAWHLLRHEAGVECKTVLNYLTEASRKGHTPSAVTALQEGRWERFNGTQHAKPIARLATQVVTLCVALNVPDLNDPLPAQVVQQYNVKSPKSCLQFLEEALVSEISDKLKRGVETVGDETVRALFRLFRCVALDEEGKGGPIFTKTLYQRYADCLKTLLPYAQSVREKVDLVEDFLEADEILYPAGPQDTAAYVAPPELIDLLTRHPILVAAHAEFRKGKDPHQLLEYLADYEIEHLKRVRPRWPGKVVIDLVNYRNAGILSALLIEQQKGIKSGNLVQPASKSGAVTDVKLVSFLCQLLSVAQTQQQALDGKTPSSAISQATLDSHGSIIRLKLTKLAGSDLTADVVFNKIAGTVALLLFNSPSDLGDGSKADAVWRIAERVYRQQPALLQNLLTEIFDGAMNMKSLELAYWALSKAAPTLPQFKERISQLAQAYLAAPTSAGSLAKVAELATALTRLEQGTGVGTDTQVLNPPPRINAVVMTRVSIPQKWLLTEASRREGLSGGSSNLVRFVEAVNQFTVEGERDPLPQTAEAFVTEVQSEVAQGNWSRVRSLARVEHDLTQVAITNYYKEHPLPPDFASLLVVADLAPALRQHRDFKGLLLANPPPPEVVLMYLPLRELSRDEQFRLIFFIGEEGIPKYLNADNISSDTKDLLGRLIGDETYLARLISTGDPAQRHIAWGAALMELSRGMNPHLELILNTHKQVAAELCGHLLSTLDSSSTSAHVMASRFDQAVRCANYFSDRELASHLIRVKKLLLASATT